MHISGAKLVKRYHARWKSMRCYILTIGTTVCYLSLSLCLYLRADLEYGYDPGGGNEDIGSDYVGPDVGRKPTSVPRQKELHVSRFVRQRERKPIQRHVFYHDVNDTNGRVPSLRSGGLRKVGVNVTVVNSKFIPQARPTHSHLMREDSVPRVSVNVPRRKRIVLDPTDVAACKVWGSTDFNGMGQRRDRRIGTGGVPLWQRKLETYGTLGEVAEDGPEYCLTELLQVRIYQQDKARWTTRELKQWLHFMFLAGVEHVYLCDHYDDEREMLRDPLHRYVISGLVTYIPWGKADNVSRNAVEAQEQCYSEVIARHGNQSRWQIAIDMDEYPFAPDDTQEGFLVRSIARFSREHGANVSEMSMQNFLMLGQGDRSSDLLVGRINRMTPESANGLSKPIFRPDRVRRTGVHHNTYNAGRNFYVNATRLRMLHYWGGRLQEWGPDTATVLNMTIQMNSMRDCWADQIRKSLVAFGDSDSFSIDTGP